MVYETEGGLGGLRPVAVIFALDDFGRRVVERLFERDEFPREDIHAYHQKVLGPREDTVCQRFTPEGGWGNVDALKAGTALSEVFRRAIGAALNQTVARRVDLILLAGEASVRNAEMRDQLLAAVGAVRRTGDRLDWAYAVASGDFEGILSGHDESAPLNKTLRAWVGNDSLDYIVLADRVRTDGARAAEQDAIERAAANTIYGVTLGPAARTLRAKLTLGRDQLDEVGRIIAIGCAALPVGDTAIRVRLEEWLVTHLANRLNSSAGGLDAKQDDQGPDKSFTQDVKSGKGYQGLETRFTDAGWDFALLTQLLSWYRSVLERLAEESLRDVIEEAGKAARAVAQLKVAKSIPSIPELREKTPLFWVLIVLGIASIVTAGLLALQADRVSLLWAVGGAIVAPVVFCSAIVFGIRVIPGSPERPPRTAEFEETIRHYRELQQGWQNCQREAKAALRYQENIKKNLRSIVTARPADVDGPLAMPENLCSRLARARGIEVDQALGDFQRDCREPLALLTSEDPRDLLHALRQSARRRLSDGPPFCWPEIVHQLGIEAGTHSDWIGDTIRWLRATSLPAFGAPGRLNWLIFMLPLDTPSDFLQAIQSTFPPPEQIMVDPLARMIMVQATQGLIEPATSDVVTPL